MLKQWSPTHAKKKGMTYHSFLDGVMKLLYRLKRFGIVSRFIMKAKAFSPESVQDTAYAAKSNLCLVGLGLRDELHFPPNLFVKTFDMLKEQIFLLLFMLENGMV